MQNCNSLNHIVKGSRIYVRVEVSCSFGESQFFWVPRLVERVMPTQFIIKCVRYRKKDGSKVNGLGGCCVAGMLGQEYTPGLFITNQLKERNLLVQNLNMCHRAERMLSGLRVDYKHPNLNAIHSKILELVDCISADAPTE